MLMGASSRALRESFSLSASQSLYCVADSPRPRRNIVSQHIRDCANEALRSIDFLLKVEGTPYTRNTHYLDDYRDKFLNYYKGIRQSAENNNLISKLSTGVPVDSESDGQFEEGLVKVLSGLSDMGIHGIQPLALARILPPALMEDAIAIMANVRAYFQGKFITQTTRVCPAFIRLAF